MAMSVVDAALSVARSAAAEEVALQVGVEGDLGIIKDELELMQTYLMSTDEERSQDPVARVWARQVRDVAYDVEDCIEDSRIHLSDDSRSWPWWRRWCSPSKILKRRRIANEVRKLRDRVDSACKRRRLYGPTTATATAPAAAAVADPSPEGSTPLVRELQAAAARVDLRKLLARRDKSLLVASVCASGTMTAASTTLVGEAYDGLAATGQFRCRAWVTVRNNPFNLGEFLRSLLRQIHVNSSPEEEQVVEGATVLDVRETIETMSTQQLMSSVARNLGHRRYLLVLDGVSTRDEWDSIRLYLRLDVDNANRIMVTSQRDDVAKYCAGGQRSSPFWLSSGGAFLSAFCNMEPVVHVPDEASTRASNPGNMASTSRAVIEEPVNSVIPERMQDEISTMGTTEELQQLVGRVKEKSWLINKLSSSANENENVIPVYGLRGIGKTTLVGDVYYCDPVVQNFAYRAWVRVSNSLKKDELLCNVLQHFKSDYRTYSSVRPSQEMKRELGEFFEINRHKGFRCLIVIDGLSSTGEWDLVKSSLFVEDHKDVLRIIVTTRERELAYYCSRSESMWNLTRLHEDDSAKLFRLKVFASENFELTPDMVEQETQILDKCGGIPFAIINLAQHMTSRPRTAREWKKINQHMNFNQLEVNTDLGPMRAILESCYNSLPYYFKYCFLYLSIFQEDIHIMRRRLVKRWIAEGYIRGMQESEAEETGERVFNVFLSMSIIQPTKYTAITSGRVNSCSIHPLMLQVSTSKAMEEKLVCMLDNHHNNAMALEGTIRHVVVRRTWRRDYYEDEYKSMNVSCVRSLTVFGEWRSFFLSPDMIMLRVLDLEGVVGLTGPDLDHIGEFRHLKYLGLRSTGVKSLPKSLGKLQDLETLDIRYTHVRVLPSTIVHLARLCVLRGGLFSAFTDPETDDRVHGGTGLHLPKDIGKLRSLNTLGIVSIRVQDGLIPELKKLTQLRRLSLVGITNENQRDLCYTLQHHVSSLQSLTLRSDDWDGLSRILEPQSLERLQVLKLRGHLFSLPVWLSRLPYLSKLYLHSTRLRGSSDDMNVLAQVPNLSTLLLLADSILAHELTFRSAGFRLLELMEVANLGDLRYLSFKTGSMPMLKTIQITGCNFLKELSVEAGALPRLEAFQVEGCYGLRSLSLAACAGIKMPMLNKFHVGACHNLASLAFREDDMPNLETLLVSRSRKLSVEFQAGAMPKLKTLRVSRCRKLKWLPLGISAGHDRGMSSSPVEAGAMPNLETLRIEHCHGLQRLPFRCGAMPKLLSLRVEKCDDLMELSFEQGATAKLETLQIKDCSRLTGSALSGLHHLNNLSSSAVI